ncbi:MAG: 50S ribosomal protein L18 [Candidatus Vogelbacteria bacterium RIFOXYD1_FULL_44_32]|uniref:Large ribosomal subunit protein uL18 n=1 Tax=Candidatus Vogelbacteria bacterium RIFOXYD1_FULL_44_32 TaxID=1802438 RepID=A0A1G2QFF3_9BACT|nr:MAG: 50S ribosomal protein L18 [Candidatus Vogelbacteria bacterium RIFOXYD1_FULL_44_32]
MIGNIQKKKNASKERRHRRIRTRLSGTATRPRLVVAKSNRYTQVALVDDNLGHTLLAANTKGAKAPKDSEFSKVVLAQALGVEIAKLAKDKKITKVVFDRGGNRYTGRVKAVADGARAGGLEF